MKVTIYPLSCPNPKCGAVAWNAMRAVDTGALALECDTCGAFVDFGQKVRNVPTFKGKPGQPLA